MLPMHRNQSVSVHRYDMVPRSDIPRSRFKKPTAHKTTFSAAYLVPVYLDEVLPGDTFELNATMFARMSTPIYPIMDNLYLESFFLFVPMRLVWIHYDRFFGAQNNPADSTSYTIPVCNASAGGYPIGSLGDYMGLGTAGQITGVYSHSALPFRAYNLIWNLWFRDENLQNSATWGSTSSSDPITGMDDGPDPIAQYTLLKRGKRADYFTTCLPFTQKGTPVSVPVTGQAIVKTQSTNLLSGNNPGGTTVGVQYLYSSGGGGVTGGHAMTISGASSTGMDSSTAATAGAAIYPANLYADLSTAVNVTINQLRLAVATQRVLEKDARGGTRYQEKVMAHFGVRGADARLNRPEYLGGGKQPVQLSPIPQTTATGLTGGSTPIGTLSAMGQVLAHGHGFRHSFTEHGYILGLVSINADLTYQQGIRRLWQRSTQYDFYLPEFANLGEQPVTNSEIFMIGGGYPMGAQDALVFGYQERWAELRTMPSLITGYFRSTAATPIDSWHLAEKFGTLPALNSTFIQSTTDATVQRAIAAGAAGANQQFIFDSYFDVTVTRLMPMYSIPGLMRF